MFGGVSGIMLVDTDRVAHSPTSEITVHLRRRRSPYSRQSPAKREDLVKYLQELAEKDIGISETDRFSPLSLRRTLRLIPVEDLEFACRNLNGSQECIDRSLKCLEELEKRGLIPSFPEDSSGFLPTSTSYGAPIMTSIALTAALKGGGVTAPIAPLFLGVLAVVGIGFYFFGGSQPQEIPERPFARFYIAANEKHFPPLSSRNALIDQVFQCWASTSQTVRKHPIIVGDGSVGKTTIMNEIARRVATGEYSQKLPPEFKDRIVYGGSTPSLVRAYSSSSDEFDRRIQQIKDRIILALDDVHTILNEEQGPYFKDKLKAMLDTSPSQLKYVLATATTEEYEKYIVTDPTLRRRFRRIDVKGLDEEETVKALEFLLQENMPSFDAPEGFLSEVYRLAQELVEEFPALKQPAISNSLLLYCIRKLRAQIEIPPPIAELARLQEELKKKEFRSMLRFDTHLRTEVEQLRVQIRSISQQVAGRKSAIAKWKKLELRITDLKEKTRKLAICLNKNGMKEAEYKLFLFFYFFLIPRLEREKSELETKFEFPKLSINLLNGVVNEYRESLRKVKR